MKLTRIDDLNFTAKLFCNQKECVETGCHFPNCAEYSVNCASKEIADHIEQLQQQLADAQEKDKARCATISEMSGLIAQAQRDRDEALAILAELDLLASDSAGVAGYHMNGDVAKWDEFSELFDGAQALQELKRREQVKGIRAAVCALKMPRYQQSPYVVLDDDLEDYANKIESGEVTP